MAEEGWRKIVETFPEDRRKSTSGKPRKKILPFFYPDYNNAIMMDIKERTDAFYLGRTQDGKPLFIESKQLTTHAVCLGMTGSGKTGLGIALMEEAGLHQIPALIIDPKGDLGNLLLTFPNLSEEEFFPWVDDAEARRKGVSHKEYAEEIAAKWRNGLDEWGQGPKRIEALRNAVDLSIYTPASRAGIPLSILSSFAAPTKEFLQDAEAVRERILSVTSALLGLLGISADPIQSREHIFLSALIEQAWQMGRDLDIAAIIQFVQKPPFDKIGVLDIDTFFPPKERLSLAISLNNLLASPGFQAWMDGDPLDIQQLLFTQSGKPKLSILSIAHLSDSERMFFVTLLLNELISWMRKQPGTSSLRALLYMDEIFGFFPPTAMPPSKIPMLMLLKQARAYGIGVVVATQNPVDLDYKGLSNCGTWLIGKLQTERDKMRILEGLSSASNGEMNSSSLDSMLAAAGKRKFILRSIYEKDPILFETRWTLSYLRGPLTLAQISKLTKSTDRPSSSPSPAPHLQGAKPFTPPGIAEVFIRRPNAKNPLYHPSVIGFAKLHYVDAKSKLDLWETVCMCARYDEDFQHVVWEEGTELQDFDSLVDTAPLVGSAFEELPGGLMNEKNYASFGKKLLAHLYRTQQHSFYYLPDLNLFSKPDETEEQFRLRIAPHLNEKRDEEIGKLKAKYREKKDRLLEKAKRAEDKLSERKQKALWRIIEAALSFLTTLIGAFVGRGVTKGTIKQTGTSVRRAGRIGRDQQNTVEAEEEYQDAQLQLQELQEELNIKTADMTASLDHLKIPLETMTVRPRKNDMYLEKIMLAWSPED